MESYEASRTVFTRIKTLDPENASKIMGYILLHHGENDMIHLSFSPQPLLLSLINRAKTHLGLSSNTFSAPLLTPISDPIPISRPNPLSLSLSSPVSPSPPSIWSPHHKDQNLGPFLSDPGALPGKNGDFSDPSLELSMSPSYCTSSCGETNGHNFLHGNDSSYYASDDSTSGFGFKPCLYYSRGFCKNGSNCNFVHGNYGGVDDDYDVAFEQCQDEICRSKIVHQHRLAAQLMANGVTLPYNKLNFLHSEARRSATALMMSEDYQKLNRLRMARNDFGGMDCNPSSRQIYLTFPADSTFKEEDVSNYFNKFGPVQDVRIPYQQKRMFGFVTFVFPETVKIILAKGNPHFVCESRVLVKPYKEKGKLPDKKLHQFERGEFSCCSPSGLDCREPFDLPLGGRMLYNGTQEMLLRKKLEDQAELQHALELQERRLMNLQLSDLKSQRLHASVGSPVQSPNTPSQVSTNQTTLPSSNGIDNQVASEVIPNVEADEEVNTGLNGNVPKKEDHSPNRGENEFFESFDHLIPDHLFASPTKSPYSIRPVSFSPAVEELDNDTPSKAPIRSCFFQKPRISNGHGAIGM